MIARVRMLPIFVVAISMSACGEKTREADMSKRGSEIEVNSDPAGPAKFLRMPGPIAEVRWTEVPIVPGTRDGIGPADTRLYVVLRLDPGAWPAWKKALRPTPGESYDLDEAVASKLLPPEWLAASKLDSQGKVRRLDGESFDPDSLATSWYHGSAAVRHGDHLFLEFFSR